MAILIAEDNIAQRAYLRDLLEREFAAYQPILEAADGESVVKSDTPGEAGGLIGSAVSKTASLTTASWFYQ